MQLFLIPADVGRYASSALRRTAGSMARPSGSHSLPGPLFFGASLQPGFKSGSGSALLALGRHTADSRLRMAVAYRWLSCREGSSAWRHSPLCRRLCTVMKDAWGCSDWLGLLPGGTCSGWFGNAPAGGAASGSGFCGSAAPASLAVRSFPAAVSIIGPSRAGAPPAASAMPSGAPVVTVG